MRRSIGRVLLIASREVRSLVLSPSIHFLLASYLLLAGILYVNHVQAHRQATLESFHLKLATLWLFLIPAVATRGFTDERRGGTDVLYATAPVGPSGLVWGKFLGLWAFILAGTLASLPYALLLAAYADPDPGPLAGATLGLVLLGSVLLAAGIFVSTLSSSPILTTIGGLTIGLILWWAIPLGHMAGGLAGTALASLSTLSRFANMTRGVLATADIGALLLLTAFFLSAATRGVEARRW